MVNHCQENERCKTNDKLGGTIDKLELIDDHSLEDWFHEDGGYREGTSYKEYTDRNDHTHALVQF